ncbi:IclR family transcriptional regulator domain-containing protein [Parvularcula oceani]|uniref:IclR family transcriptional regulator domain-containing protein n=1 Tax=Parvularcula oceani TaxID=1247963 RepID=UPI0004E2385C|nr:IclR family transcriptional regulator C-terminal domain-containing protein [Parvularcula oceani]
MTTPVKLDAESREYVTSFARGLEVIRAFTRSRPRMTLSEVANATGMTRATARRFLLTLVVEEYVAFDGKHYSLQPKVLQLGYSALSSMELWEVAAPVLQSLADRLQETCLTCVLHGANVIYTAKAMSQRLVNIGITVGSSAPAHCVSSGRVMLSALPEEELDAYLDALEIQVFTPNTTTSKVKLRSEIEKARGQGWAIVDQEMELGLRSVSVPIRDIHGAVVAALNIPCPTSRLTMEDIKTKIVAEMLTASHEITQGLKQGM